MRVKRRARLVLTALVAGAAVAAGVLLAWDRGGEPARTTASPVAAPSLSPGNLAWDSSFRVAPAPLSVGSGGPAPAPAVPCHGADVVAAARTRRSPDGVLGVVRLTGRHCALHLALDRVRLLDASHRALDVQMRAEVVAVNAPANRRPDLALAAGAAAWGFRWRGSWCGARATAIELPLSGSTASPFTIPLVGPSPVCGGAARAVLVPGVVGSPTEPVLPPPAAWSRLRAVLHLAGTTSAREVRGAEITLVNSFGDDVALAPCADYASTTSVTTSRSLAYASGVAHLPCPARPAAVPAHGSLTYRLAPLELPFDGIVRPPPGDAVRVQVAIAGIPTASATTVVE